MQSGSMRFAVLAILAILAMLGVIALRPYVEYRLYAADTPRQVEALAHLARRHDVVALDVADPLEQGWFQELLARELTSLGLPLTALPPSARPWPRMAASGSGAKNPLNGNQASVSFLPSSGRVWWPG